MAWSLAWFALAMLFAAAIFVRRSRAEALQFTAGYVIELTLSLDNVMVMAVIFAYFRVPREYQHRLLFWGILGVLIMRGAMICAGVTIVAYYDWILYVLGALLVCAGIKMLVSKKQMEPEKNLVLRAARKFFSVSENLDGRKFLTRVNGRLFLTPLALALMLIETTGSDFRHGFRARRLFRDPECLYHFHLKRFCDSRPALDVFSARRAPSAISVT